MEITNARDSLQGVKVTFDKPLRLQKEEGGEAVWTLDNLRASSSEAHQPYATVSTTDSFRSNDEFTVSALIACSCGWSYSYEQMLVSAYYETMPRHVSVNAVANFVSHLQGQRSSPTGIVVWETDPTKTSKRALYKGVILTEESAHLYGFKPDWIRNGYLVAVTSSYKEKQGKRGDWIASCTTIEEALAKCILKGDVYRAKGHEVIFSDDLITSTKSVAAGAGVIANLQNAHGIQGKVKALEEANAYLGYSELIREEARKVSASIEEAMKVKV